MKRFRNFLNFFWRIYAILLHSAHYPVFADICAKSRIFAKPFHSVHMGPRMCIFLPKRCPFKRLISKLTFRFFKFVWQYPLGRTCRGRGGLGAARCFPWPHPGGRLPATPPTSTVGPFSFFPTNFDMLAVSFQSLFLFQN